MLEIGGGILCQTMLVSLMNTQVLAEFDEQQLKQKFFLTKFVFDLVSKSLVLSACAGKFLFCHYLTNFG